MGRRLSPSHTNPMSKHIIKSYAKLNTALHLYPPRSDGYHPLHSIFQSITLHDTLTITLSKEKNYSLTTSDSTLDNTSNLITKAYSLLQNVIPFGLSIHLEKQIPIGGGLGGGSSNAGYFLQFLKQQLPSLSTQQLHTVATQLGSDVPFFLTGGRAVVSGIGETIESLPSSPQAYVLINPNILLPTPSIYQAFDNETPSTRTPQTTKNFLKQSTLGENDFKEIVWKNYPLYPILETTLNEAKLPPIYLSGSGATVYMCADSPEHAQKLADKIQTLFPNYWVRPTHTL